MASTANRANETGNVGDVLRAIGRDVKTIAVDELELTRRQLSDYMADLVIKASVSLLGATVALIGIGMLCMVAVTALEPVIEPLWLRLLLLAVVYIVIGSGAAYLWAKRMTAMRGPNLDKAIAEARDTIEAVNNGLEHGGKPHA